MKITFDLAQKLMTNMIFNREFASSGRKSGDNLYGLLFINPITLKGPEFTNG